MVEPARVYYGWVADSSRLPSRTRHEAQSGATVELAT